LQAIIAPWSIINLHASPHTKYLPTMGSMPFIRVFTAITTIFQRMQTTDPDGKSESLAILFAPMFDAKSLI